MATMKTTTVTIPLFGHGLEVVGNLARDPRVTGNFSAETVIGNDGVIWSASHFSQYFSMIML